MTTALIYFGASAGTLLLLSILYIVEDTKGERIILPSVRDWLDRAVSFVLFSLRHVVVSVWKWVAQFVLRHGVSRLLAVLVRYLNTLEDKVEVAVLRHRQQSKRQTKPRNHLDEIAEHKESVALSEEDRLRMRDY